MHQPTSIDPIARLAERAALLSPHNQLRAQQAIRSLFNVFGPNAQRAREVLHGTSLHEPLHVIMTDVPIGSWTAATLFDTIGAASGSKTLDSAADALVLLGLAGAAGASLTGINDWSEIKPAAPRRVGITHAALNVAATGLFLASALYRRRKTRTSTHRRSARLLGLLGFAVVSISSHLGGNMIYEHGIGVERGKAWQD